MRITEGSYYKKTSLLSIRAALDRHLKAPIINVIIPKQLLASRDVNIGEVHLGDYSPVFTSQ